MTIKRKMITGQRLSTGIRLTGITILLLFLFISIQHVKAQSPITFSDESIENNFPDKLVFRISAGSSAGEITAAKLYYRFRNDLSETQVIVDLTPAGEVDLTYTWETGDITIPPSTPVFYHWEITDAAGNRVSSQEELFYYDDIRYDWQVLENDNLAVWWHDRPETFGEKVYDIANQAFDGQRTLYGAGLTYPIRIIVYNNDAEFAGWHSYVSEFIGGQAFPPLGITTQIVPESESLNHWLKDVIPHEISHLYFYQATYHPLVITPAWLNEGLAQYNEFNDNSFAIELAKKEIRTRKLIPLTALTGSFGYNEEKVRLAYAESVSAVVYIVETYGEDGLAALLAAYRDGLPDQAAFERAFDKNLSDFEIDWLTWMGAPEGMYGTATPTVTLSLPPNPTMAGIDSYQATETSEPDIIPSGTPAETTTPQAVKIKETQATAIAQADLPDQDSTDAGADPVNQSSRLVCLGGLLPGLLIWVGVRDRLKRDEY